MIHNGLSIPKCFLWMILSDKLSALFVTHLKWRPQAALALLISTLMSMSNTLMGQFVTARKLF